ncbi:hypothetical protein H7F33_06925 [Pedobacter sp. PAMC26386]|nr:hypothetical protein H7F33_06925 [Pedobacter sp. PAMC26386]
MGINTDMSNWMSDVFGAAKEHYTLKDIVIPGSHDAGMSVLTATGGSQKGTINDCNTLTQSLNIETQMKTGIRMFDLRAGILKDTLYLKHSSSDCMDDAVGGGYGEELEPVLLAARKFLKNNKSEFLILTFSHFCPKEIGIPKLAEKIVNIIGKEHTYMTGDKKLGDIKIADLKGKILLVFETSKFDNPAIVFNTMIDASDGIINFRRAYAATNNLKKLISTESVFFNTLKTQMAANDLIRLDWQLTQSAKEAAMVCNAFESDQNSPVFDGAVFLANVLSRHKSIITHARNANKILKTQLNQWIADQTINHKNKPNILYVDDAGSWITQYCVELNQTPLYHIE